MSIQDLELDAALDAENSAPMHRSMLHGALGSYQFYDHVVSCLGLDSSWSQRDKGACSHEELQTLSGTPKHRPRGTAEVAPPR